MLFAAIHGGARCLCVENCMKNNKKRYDWLRPTIRDWAAFAIFVIFSAVTPLVFSSNSDLGIYCLVFFGFGSIVAGLTVFRKIRESNFDGSSVDVIGGVAIRPSRPRLMVYAFGLSIFGATMAVFGTGMPIFLRLIGGGLLALGITMVILGLLKKLPAGFIRFDVDRFVLGNRRYTIGIEWDNMARIEPGNIHNNSAVFVWLKSPQAIHVEPSKSITSALKSISWTEQWYGAHLALITEIYGLPGPMVAAALTRYKSHPEAREELRNKYIT